MLNISCTLHKCHIRSLQHQSFCDLYEMYNKSLKYNWRASNYMYHTWRNKISKTNYGHPQLVDTNTAFLQSTGERLQSWKCRTWLVDSLFAAYKTLPNCVLQYGTTISPSLGYMKYVLWTYQCQPWPVRILL